MISTPTSTPTALAVTLGGRELGLAVFAPHGPLAVQVLNLRKIRSRENREARFRARLTELLETHAPGLVVAVVPDAHGADHALVEAERAWLMSQAALMNATLLVRARRELLDTLVGKPKAGARDLAELLEREEPALWSFLPSAVPPPGAELIPGLTWRNRRVRSPRERYWQNALIAAAAAREALRDLAS